MTFLHSRPRAAPSSCLTLFCCAWNDSELPKSFILNLVCWVHPHFVHPCINAETVWDLIKQGWKETESNSQALMWQSEYWHLLYVCSVSLQPTGNTVDDSTWAVRWGTNIFETLMMPSQQYFHFQKKKGFLGFCKCVYKNITRATYQEKPGTWRLISDTRSAACSAPSASLAHQSNSQSHRDIHVKHVCSF